MQSWNQTHFEVEQNYSRVHWIQGAVVDVRGQEHLDLKSSQNYPGTYRELHSAPLHTTLHPPAAKDEREGMSIFLSEKEPVFH